MHPLSIEAQDQLGFRSLRRGILVESPDPVSGFLICVAHKSENARSFSQIPAM
ncbi:hypothetical protein L207DRAFT_506196 [Hyaloscypha variabilis F]|uniref:Uncharacterized protein n=1 Tax=Hyaloscypha variabilis (strain UAMH 11265 / GT02V1 / F) TaxID=1149755 RepID=A0A2J6S8T9_HYAVF|nr:hypothetical protein L207DRAFT_506196 [Hyaloscypha variabilis F]